MMAMDMVDMDMVDMDNESPGGSLVVVVVVVDVLFFLHIALCPSFSWVGGTLPRLL